MLPLISTGSTCLSVRLSDCLRVCLTVCVAHPARIFVSFNVSDICTRLSPPLLRVCLQQSFPTTTISHLSPFHFFPRIIFFFFFKSSFSDSRRQAAEPQLKKKGEKREDNKGRSQRKPERVGRSEPVKVEL